jgi:[acyl-carrier-protein] S-malonyltransferase
MKQAGVDHFVEFGGKVLSPMVSRTVKDVSITSVVTMADIEALAKEI